MLSWRIFETIKKNPSHVDNQTAKESYTVEVKHVCDTFAV